jgi:hypothetical protein
MTTQKSLLLTCASVFLAVIGFAGDAVNNASALLGGASWSYSDIGKILISVLFSGACTIFGYGAARRKTFTLFAIIAIISSAGLTAFAQLSDLSGKKAGSARQELIERSLLDERDQLMQSLTGPEPCAKQRWCDSQAKERRVAEINQSLADLAQKSVVSSDGVLEKLNYFVVLVMCLAVPIINTGLSCLGGAMAPVRERADEGRQPPAQAGSPPPSPEGDEDSADQSPHGQPDQSQEPVKPVHGTGIGPVQFRPVCVKPVPKKPVSSRPVIIRANPSLSSLDKVGQARALIYRGVKPSTNALKKAGVKGSREEIQGILRTLAESGLLTPPQRNGGSYTVNKEAKVVVANQG